jgi:hypothetical protein
MRSFRPSPVAAKFRPLRAFNVYGYTYTIKPPKRDTGRFRPLHVDSVRTGYNDAPRATVPKARKRATTGATLDGCISVSRPAGTPPRANVGDPGRATGSRRYRATGGTTTGDPFTRQGIQSRPQKSPKSPKSKVGKVALLRKSGESGESPKSRVARESKVGRVARESIKSRKLGELIKSRCQSRESRESGESESRSSTAL